MSFGEKIKILFSNIWDFILPYIKKLLSRAGTIVAEEAYKAVLEVASSTLSGDDERRDAAINIALNNLKSRGIEVGKDVGMSFLKASLELAVQKLKDSEN